MDSSKTYPQGFSGGESYPQLTEIWWNHLKQVNSEVNAANCYTPDIEQYDKPDFWEFINGEGDCEDYALEKYRRLLALGFPKESLRLNIVQIMDGKGGGYHAILTADFKNGTYVLDNRYDYVMPANIAAMRYRFLRRQVPGRKMWEGVVQPSAT